MFLDDKLAPRLMRSDASWHKLKLKYSVQKLSPHRLPHSSNTYKQKCRGFLIMQVRL